MEGLITLKELTERWKVSRSTVYRIVDKGNLSVYKIGSHLRFRPEDIRSYEEGVLGWNINLSKGTTKTHGISTIENQHMKTNQTKQFRAGFQRGRKMRRGLENISTAS